MNQLATSAFLKINVKKLTKGKLVGNIIKH